MVIVILSIAKNFIVTLAKNLSKIKSNPELKGPDTV